MSMISQEERFPVSEISQEERLPRLYAAMQEEMRHSLLPATIAYTHPGTKGDNTEANWIDWFRAYLPKRYQVDKGVVIDSEGNESNQIDIVIYDTQYSYLVFHQGASKLIPAESVYAVFEVKQTLNKEYIDYACERAASVRRLKRTSAPIKHAGGEYKPKALHAILAGVLTTKSDYKKQMINHIVENLAERDPVECLDFVCAISGGAVVIEHDTFLTSKEGKKNPEEKVTDENKENKQKENEQSIPEIQYCEEDEALVFLLLNLLRRLQDIGTVPAIKFTAYAEKINSHAYTPSMPIGAGV